MGSVMAIPHRGCENWIVFWVGCLEWFALDSRFFLGLPLFNSILCVVGSD